MAVRTHPLHLLAPILLALACAGDSPVVVTAGELEFRSHEVVGLSHDRLLLLGELAAFGTAVADSMLLDPGRPWVEAQATGRLWAQLRAQAALDSAGVGDDMLYARYRTAPEFELTVRHLLVFSARYETEATRAQARAKAAAALTRIRAGEPFETVAAQVSDEPGAESRQGLLTPGRRGTWVAEFWGAASALAPGEISPVVETQYGFHVLRLEARDTVPFAEARPRLALEVAALMGVPPATLDQVPLPVSLPEPPGPDVLLDASAPDETVVVSGDGWTVDLGEVRDAAALLGYARWSRRADDPDVRSSAFEAAVRRSVVRARARTAGVTLDDDLLAGLRREWIDRGEIWALQLGFAPGRSPEQVRTGALAALAATGQNATLARDGLRTDWGPLLHRWFPITVDETHTPSPA